MREVEKGGGGQRYWGKRRRRDVIREGTEKGNGKKWRKDRARERETENMGHDKHYRGRETRRKINAWDFMYTYK